MKQHRFKVMALTAVLTTGVAGAVSVHATDVDDILKAGKSNVATAKASQKRIDKISNDTGDIVQEFRGVSEQIESAKLYNQMLELQIADQERRMAELRTSIAGVQDTERQIPPLIHRMVDTLEEFIAVDLPFKRELRRENLESLRNDVGRADMSVAERFRRVLQIYTEELGYGSVGSLEATSEEIELDGQPQLVDILRLGRVALVYQTKDKSRTGAWDQDARQWVELDSGDYRSAIATAIRIAKKTATRDILTLPIKAPEVAQ